MELDIDQKRELVTALLKCSAISDQGARDRVIGDLPPEIRGSVTRHQSDIIDIANLVSRCSEFPQGLEALIEIVRSYEGDSDPMREVLEIWSRLTASQGLDTLAKDLMQDPKVRAAVMKFRANFEAARKQIDVLGDYKALHDLLHTLQFQCYYPIVLNAGRFPHDDIFVEDELENYKATLQEIVNRLQETVKKETFAMDDTTWIQGLVDAREALGKAIKELNREPLRQAIWDLGHILAVQPSKINRDLKAAAKALKLLNLAKAMEHVKDTADSSKLDQGKLSQLKAGSDNLVSLDERLTALVRDHDRWQVIDDSLRLIESSIERDTMDLEMSWPHLKAKTEPLYKDSTEEWATSFKEKSDNLDSAIAAEDTGQVKRCFRRYRRQAGVRFYQVDGDLKRLCEGLRKVGQSVTSVMVEV